MWAKLRPLFIVCLGYCLLGAGGKYVDINVLKAAYLNKFAQFVSWPQSDSLQQQTAFSICVYQDGSLYEQMRDKLQARSIKQQQIEIDFLSEVSQATECQVLYLGDPTIKDLANALTLSKANNVLLITEHPGAADVGVHINLMREVINEQNVLLFEVNQDSFKQSNLEVSFKLLKLAKKVVTTSGDNND